MGKPRIFLHDKIYIPVTEVSEKRVVKEYTHYEFDDNICRGCPMRHQRPCADCRECEWGGLKTSFLLANRKTNNGKAYYTIPMGDFENVERKLRIDFDDFKVVDRTKRIPFDYPIKFTAELYDYQIAPVERLKRYKMGILKSKPRTGKSCMAVAAMCKLGLRTIIMADQKDFLDGFYETIEQMTNLPALEEKTGRKLFGFPKKLEDFENFQVVLVTYQSLIKNTSVCKKRLKALRKNYGALFVDEVHRTCAPEFTKVLGKMTTRVRIGLSATPRRKDCVVKGSAVVMADGSRKAIEDVAVGDLVTSFNIAEGAFEPKPVVMTHAVQTAKRRVRVRHASGVLECTEDHEVWTANRGYVKAIDLTTSDVIQLGDD